MMWWRKKKVKLQLTEDEMAAIVRRRMLEPARFVGVQVDRTAQARFVIYDMEGRETGRTAWFAMNPTDMLRLRGYDIYPTSQP